MQKIGKRKETLKKVLSNDIGYIEGWTYAFVLSVSTTPVH